MQLSQVIGKDIFSMKSNKVELFKFLSEILLGSFNQEPLITNGESAKS